MNVLILPIMIPLLTAVICLFRVRSLLFQNIISITGSFALLIATVQVMWTVMDQNIAVLQLGSWKAPWGITLVGDYLSAGMLLVSAVILVATVAFSIIQGKDKDSFQYYHPLIHLLMMGVNGAFLTGDIFNLYVWFEVMLIASFVLMVFGRKKSQLEGGFKYVTINILASFVFLAGIGILYGKTGTLNMADIAQALKSSEDAVFINSTVVLLLVAFGIKSAIFPLYFWLPASYHTLPTPLAALFAGLLTKVGVYSFMRAFTLFFGQSAEVFAPILLVLACLTMVTGVLGAASKYDIKQILSFHIISQIGYILFSVALFSAFSLASALFYTIHHIIVKSNLFLVAGIIASKFGTTDLKKMGGLYKVAPALALLFAIPAMSLGGIPPLSGFWAKLMVITSAVQEAQLWVALTAILVGILTLFSMTKIWNEAFWKQAPDQPEKPTPVETGKLIYLPSAALALLTLVISLNPSGLVEYCNTAAKQLTNSNQYIEAVLTSTQVNKDYE